VSVGVFDALVFDALVFDASNAFTFPNFRPSTAEFYSSAAAFGPFAGAVAPRALPFETESA
jgi:hypothetical protein